MSNTEWSPMVQEITGYVRRHAAEHAEQLLASKESAHALLTHDMAIVRICALHCCCYIWRCQDDRSFQSLLLKAIDDDDDDVARSVAIGICGIVFLNIDNGSARQALARIVLDKNTSTSNTLRSRAYASLWLLATGDDNWEHYEEYKIAYGKGEPPLLRHVHWEWVRREARGLISSPC